MARSRSSHRTRGGPLLTLVLLAAVTGFVFAGTGEEMEPPREAHDAAAQAAAVLIALDVPLFEPAGAALPLESREAQTLLVGETQVRLAHNVSRVRIASVGIDAEVRSVGYVFTDGELRYDVPRVGAGHYSGTAPPGDAGNAVIAGHVSTRSGPAVFRNLPDVRPGDTVEVFSGDQVFRYVITEIRVVAPEATAVMTGTTDATLTLITCSPGNSYEQRFVVVGKLL